MLQTTFDLERFEYAALRRKHEEAARELIVLLQALDSNYGSTGSVLSARLPTELSGLEIDQHLTARIAAATIFLLADPEFRLSPHGRTQLLNWQRWLSTIFAASPFRNADVALRALNNAADSQAGDRLEVRGEDLEKFCLMYGTESRQPFDLDALWSCSRELAAGLGLALLSPRFLGTPAAHSKREQLLPWLAGKLPEVTDLDQLPTAILHDVYMHCSYADRADKHDIKRSINVLIRRKLQQHGIYSAPVPPMPSEGTKPVMLVVLEWFSAVHSIYRTHSRTLEAARERFEIIGIGTKQVDEAGRAVFDSFIELPEGPLMKQLEFVRKTAHSKQALALYMPSVGMHALTMFLANMRITPLQVMGLGHPATTHSDNIDYVVVEEDYVGDPACFSEKLLLLPADGMPYRPSAFAEKLSVRASLRPSPEVVRIAVAATTMKLNPTFMATLARIASQAARPVHFHLLVGQAIGWVNQQVVNMARQVLGDRVTVHPHQPYDQYMSRLAECDMFLNPFPFGNTNGIVDTVSVGLVGVCKTGREVHEHIDEGMFTRLGFPKWLVSTSNDEYVQAAVRLIGNDTERLELSGTLSGPEAVKRLFVGRPEIFGQLLHEKAMAKAEEAQGQPGEPAQADAA